MKDFTSATLSLKGTTILVTLNTLLGLPERQVLIVVDSPFTLPPVMVGKTYMTFYANEEILETL